MLRKFGLWPVRLECHCDNDLYPSQHSQYRVLSRYVQVLCMEEGKREREREREREMRDRIPTSHIATYMLFLYFLFHNYQLH